MVGLYSMISQVIRLYGFLSKMLAAHRLKLNLFRAYCPILYFLPADTLITQMFSIDAGNINMLLLDCTGKQFVLIH